MKDFRDLLSDSKSWSAKRRVFLHSIMGLMSRPVYKHESGWHSRNAYDCYAGDVVHEFMYCQESERLMAELEVADISLSDLQEHVVAYASENHPSVLEWFDSRWMASQNFIAVSLEIFGYISSMSEGAIDMYLQNINSEPDVNAYRSPQMECLCLLLLADKRGWGHGANESKGPEPRVMTIKTTSTMTLSVSGDRSFVSIEKGMEIGNQDSKIPDNGDDNIELSSTQWSQRLLIHGILNGMMVSYGLLSSYPEAGHYDKAVQELIKQYRLRKTNTPTELLHAADSALEALLDEMEESYIDYQFDVEVCPTMDTMAYQIMKTISVHSAQFDPMMYKDTLASYRYDRKNRRYASERVNAIADKLMQSALDMACGNPVDLDYVDDVRHTIDHVKFFDLIDFYKYLGKSQNQYSDLEGKDPQQYFHSILQNYQATEMQPRSIDQIRSMISEIELSHAIYARYNTDSWWAVQYLMGLIKGVVNQLSECVDDRTLKTKRYKSYLASRLMDALQLIIYFCEGLTDDQARIVEQDFSNLRRNKKGLRRAKLDLASFDDYIKLRLVQR